MHVTEGQRAEVSAWLLSTEIHARDTVKVEGGSEREALSESEGYDAIWSTAAVTARMTMSFWPGAISTP
jgi:hypothetical protein